MLDQGVGASGVVAANTSNPESDVFKAPTDKKEKKKNLNQFGQSLLKALKKTEKKSIK